MTPTQHQKARNATVFFIFDDETRDDLPYHRATMADARRLARRLNDRGLPAIITDQNENTLETWM